MAPRHIGTNLLDLFEAKHPQLRRNEEGEDAYCRSQDPAAGKLIRSVSTLLVACLKLAELASLTFSAQVRRWSLALAVPLTYRS